MKNNNTEQERINFDVIGLLYPRLLGIDIWHYNKLSFISINEVIKFVGTHKCSVRLNISQHRKDIYSQMTTQIIQIKSELDQNKVKVERQESDDTFTIVFYCLA